MSSRDERMDLGWDLLEQGQYSGAVDVAEEILREEPDDLEAMFLAGSALFELGEHEEGARKLGKVLEAEPSHVPARLTLAALHYETCRFAEGLREVARVLGQEPDHAYAHYLKGLLLDMEGQRAAADASFEKAAALDPDNYRLPEPIDGAAFNRAVEQALTALPEEFQDRLGNLPILVEDVPTPAVLGTLQDPAPDLLGLFVGTPLPEKSHQDLPAAPDAVYLFKRNLERAAADRDELIEEIRVTLLHEIGHYLGMDEDDLEEAGYA